MHAGNKVINISCFVCGSCKQEYTNPDAATRCEESHKDKSCEHKHCSFTGMINGRDILVTRTCMKCGTETKRTKQFEALTFWPHMEDLPSSPAPSLTPTTPSDSTEKDTLIKTLPPA